MNDFVSQLKRVLNLALSRFYPKSVLFEKINECMETVFCKHVSFNDSSYLKTFIINYVSRLYEKESFEIFEDSRINVFRCKNTFHIQLLINFSLNLGQGQDYIYELGEAWFVDPSVDNIPQNAIDLFKIYLDSELNRKHFIQNCK